MMKARRRGQRRRGGGALRVLICGIGAAAIAIPLACTDSPPAPRKPAATGAARFNQQVPPGQAKAMFHQRNPNDWVGVAHNEAMRRSRAEHLLDGGAACVKLLALAMDVARSAAAQYQRAVSLSPDAVARAATNTACGRALATRSGVSPAALRQTIDLSSLSTAARSLAEQIDSALSTASTSADLAAALLPVLNAASSLSTPGESDIITSAASVAHSSFEYWEVELTPNAVATQYSSTGMTLWPCRQQHLGLDAASLMY